VSKARSLVAAALAASLVAAAFAGPDAAPATKEYASGDKMASLSLPAAWTVSPEKLDKAAISLSAELPKNGGRVHLELLTYPGRVGARALDASSLAARRSRELAEIWKNDKILDGPRVTLDPTPQVFIQVEVKSGVLDQWLGMRTVERIAVELDVSCAKDVWGKVQDACLAALLSVKVTPSGATDPLRDYRRVARDGYSYYVQPSVPDGDVDAVHKRLRSVEAAFVKLHGAVAWTDDAPFVVVVHPTLLDAVRFDTSMDRHSQFGCYANSVVRRLSVVPPKGDAAAAELACEAWRSFIDQSGMEDYPFWLYLGEGDAAAAEAITGKSLPVVPDGVFLAIPKPLPTLEEIASVDRAYGKDVDGMFAWFAFFRCGPKPWRDAFAAFLKDGAATHDWSTAEKKNLLSLDQTKLRDAAQGWLARNLVSVKPK